MSQSPPPPPSGGSPLPPPPEAAAAGGAKTASLGVRIGARLIDHILISVVGGIVVGSIVAGLFFADAAGGGGMSMFTGDFSGAGFVVSLVGVAIVFAYFMLMDVQVGRTLGKMMLGMFVQGHGGRQRITYEESFKRNAWLLLGVVPVIGWLLQLGAAIYIMVTLSRDPENRGWHDQFAGTVVTRT